MIEHVDGLGQAIKIGDRVVFTYSYSPGVFVGTVITLTPKRIRMSFLHHWTDTNGVKKVYKGRHIARPDNCIVLSDDTLKHLTVAVLKNDI